MKIHEKFIKRCLELAVLGSGKTKSNPLVGCVIVYDNMIISEGYHKEFGGPHAEVNAINKLKEKYPSDYKKILKQSILYVNLEPCSHFGKTPPCTKFILEHNIKQVVIGTIDPNKIVYKKGITELKKQIHVISGIMSQECKNINKQYFINHTFNRPYIVIKWAESLNGYVNNKQSGITKISCKESHVLTHKWRSQVDAIMVGTNTIKYDNPQLTTRHIEGNNPTRITIDRHNSLEYKKFNIFNTESKTIIFNETHEKVIKNINYINYMPCKLKELPNNDVEKLEMIIKKIYQIGLKSVLIEGGPTIIQKLLKINLWDEIKIFRSPNKIKDGVKAPLFQYGNNYNIKKEKIGHDLLTTIINDSTKKND